MSGHFPPKPAEPRNIVLRGTEQPGSYIKKFHRPEEHVSPRRESIALPYLAVAALASGFVFGVGLLFIVALVMGWL